MFSDRLQAVFFDMFTLRPAKVRSEDYPRALFGRIFDCRKSRTNARIVVNLPVFDGNVEIDANENAFAF